MPRPHVVIYNAVSIDGRIAGYENDPRVYYRYGFEIPADVVLMGSATALAFGPEEPERDQFVELRAPERLPIVEGFESLVTEPRPLLVVPDSAGRVRNWIHALAQPWYRDILVLTSAATPAEYRDYLGRRGIRTWVVGEGRVDLARALERLHADEGARHVRTDSGGRLNGALIAAGLADELVLMVEPVVSGAPGGPAVIRLPGDLDPRTIAFERTGVEALDGGEVVVRYALTARTTPSGVDS
ncbi:RibD family protein [Microbacterium sp. CFH 90308]|uniref:RibD family protein n=1 Tax=Microbacterium salsuginis TaxID=2722803 RepID=A0ABX1KHK9_9MICO|nr:RibD family protein [Microbacterium sp. CFH 90308]NLP85478.1 RibD family protein [Microbacterium sp. CFH 90308]